MQLATKHTSVMGRQGRLVLDMRQPKRARPSGDSFPWSKVHLSTRLTSSATATIQGGSFWIGENAAVTLATSTRTITADLQYLWLEYNFTTNALTIGALAPSATLPVSASPVFVLPLAKFSYAGTTAAITDYLYLGGDFHLPGTWAA